MTRKRFIKKLMGYRVDRNSAKRAAVGRPKGYSYAEYYGYAFILAVWFGAGLRAKKAAKAFRALSSSADSFGCSVGCLGYSAQIFIADEISSLPPNSLECLEERSSC